MTGHDADEVGRLLQRADALIDVGRYDEAMGVLRSAAVAAPEDADVQAFMARAHLGLGQAKEALEAAQRASALAPEHEWPHRLRAIALMRMAKHADAVVAAQEAVRCDPSSPDGLYVLSSAQRESKKLKEAEETARRLLELTPDDRLPHSSLGLIAMDRKKWKDAEQHILKALEIEPTSAVDINNLGVVYQHTRRKKEAIDLFHRAAALDPRFEIAQENLASSVARYAGLTGLMIYFALRALSMFDRDGDGPLVGAFALVVVGGLFLVRRRRLRKLHPTVQTFYADARRRGRFVGPRSWFRGLDRRALTALAVFAWFLVMGGIGAAADPEATAEDRSDYLVVTVLLTLFAGWVTYLRVRRARGD